MSHGEPVVGWFRMDAERWEQRLARQRDRMVQVDDEDAFDDLRHMESLVRCWLKTNGEEGRRWPGRGEFAKRWGWAEWDVRKFIARDHWHDPNYPVDAKILASTTPRQTRRASDSDQPSTGSPPGRHRVATGSPPGPEPLNADTLPNPTGSPPGPHRVPTGSPAIARLSEEAHPLSTQVDTTPLPPRGGRADEPVLVEWVPRAARDRGGHPGDVVLATVVGCIQAVRGGIVNPNACATDARKAILPLWKALGWYDPPTFLTHFALLADAAKWCPDRLFARDVRGEGWDGAVDRSSNVKTLAAQSGWGDRLAVAQKWDAAGRPRGGARPVNGGARAPGRRSLFSHMQAEADTGRGRVVLDAGDER